MQQLLTLSWWFTLRPAPIQSSLGRVLLIVLPLVLIALAIAIPLLRRAGVWHTLLPRMGARLVRFCATLGMVSLLLTFSRFEGIPFFSMRMWWALWVVGAIVWAVYIVRASLKIPGSSKSAAKYQDEYLKYLPR